MKLLILLTLFISCTTMDSKLANMEYKAREYCKCEGSQLKFLRFRRDKEPVKADIVCHNGINQVLYEDDVVCENSPQGFKSSI